MDGSVSSSASTHTVHASIPESLADQPCTSTSASVATSPPSSALPSPPDSPSSDSVSSFPSVSSSFFFSSAAASPPHSQPHSGHLREPTEALIIPSLTLPAALRRPTACGKTIGDMRLLVLGDRDTGKNFPTDHLLEGNDAVVDVCSWEETEHGRVLYASTDWIEHKDAHGLEKYESTRNIEIFDIAGYSDMSDMSDGVELVRSILSIIHMPFRALSEVLHPEKPLSPLIANLLSSSSTPLFTAMILLLPSAPTTLDQYIISEVGNHVPLIILPRLRSHNPCDTSTINLDDKLSAFRPSTAVALRSGLFNSTETLSLLRAEATDRFFRWREVERIVSQVQQPHANDSHESISRWDSTGNKRYHPLSMQQKRGWDGTKWESEYLASFSHDVAERKREAIVTRRRVSQLSLKSESSNYDEDDAHADELQQEASCAPLDPLHLPSLLFFSISLLNPLRAKLNRSIANFLESLGSEPNVRVALFGGFCFGLGIGIMVKS